MILVVDVWRKNIVSPWLLYNENQTFPPCHFVSDYPSYLSHCSCYSVMKYFAIPGHTLPFHTCLGGRLLSSWKYISWTLMKSSTKGHTWENISVYAESRAFICSLSRVNCWVVIVRTRMSFSSTMGLLQWCAHLYWECTTVAGIFACS